MSVDNRWAPPSGPVEIADKVYAFVQPDGSWWINNAGFVVGRSEVISVDACATEGRTRAYLRAINAITERPVRTLVNTHHHGDHTYGNYLFEDATIVGHERIRETLLRWAEPKPTPFWTEVEWGDIRLAPPFLTYQDRVCVYADELRCEVTYVGTAAHTTSDSYVWIPEHKVLFSGDLLFNGVTPFLLQGSITGALSALETLRTLGAETIVPGHGEVCGPEVIDDVAGYVQFVLDVAIRGRDAGLSPLEAARETDLGAHAGLLDSERIVGNLHRAYAELEGLEPGGRLDSDRALADMVEFNGGKPLNCHA